MYMNIEKIAYVKLRLAMAFIFLWAFFDKTFGWGFATQSESAWIHGGSPTYGFLTHGTHGPFAEFFQSLAGIAIVDWMFMLGLLFVGLTLAFNRYVVWGAIAGGTMMLLMWLAALPPENNPIIDDHIIYILVLTILAFYSRKVSVKFK
jgi:thiosulfate dehydrogenase (quinone) large subunit